MNNIDSPILCFGWINTDYFWTLQVSICCSVRSTYI